MFRLTRLEKQVVAVMMSALLVGTAVKYWRAQQGPPQPAAVSAEQTGTN